MPTSIEGDSRAKGLSSGVTRVVVVTTVMLTFISFWRAAAIVLNDLASTAYYIGGITEEAIGKSAPWFILAVMLFSYCVRAVYVESCSMFVRGGVYRIVREAMGSTMAKLSVSALMFDYVLTGPISAVSAGQYLHGLLENGLHSISGHGLGISAAMFSVLFALGVTAYFWRLNLKGIEESSDKALKIMQITTVMVAILIVWCLLTMLSLHHAGQLHLPPLWPSPGDLKEHSLGWLSGVPWVKTISAAVFMVAFGHSILAMSGEETLAQVYREIEAPKHKNLMRAGTVIFIYSLVFTSFVSFAAVMIIPDASRTDLYKDNLINGLVMYMIGPHFMKLVFQAFVVVVGALILSGAVNTSIVGSNGVLNRVAEDGVLDDWFRTPHGRYGTTHRIINLVAILQIVTILISRGDIYMLGEAYAFGVVWSFMFKGLAMLMLRWKYKGERGWKVPGNPKICGVEIPVGLGAIVLILFLVAMTNLFTKKVATVSGVSFTAGFFLIFVLSEWHNKRKNRHVLTGSVGHTEKFVLERKSEVSATSLELPPGSSPILVPIRDPNNLSHLVAVFQNVRETAADIVVLTVKVEKGDQAFDHPVTKDEEKLFSRVVEIAEKHGQSVYPIVVPSNNSWFAIARTAYEIGAKEIVLGMSGRVPADVQLEQLAMMWGMAGAEGNREINLRIVSPMGEDICATI